jgi:hypothetical protein
MGKVTLRRFTPVNIIPSLLSTLIYHLGDEQAHWWPQFRDTASAHRHEQQQEHNASAINKQLRPIRYAKWERNFTKIVEV